ncbi:MAG: metal ABC transporter permease [Desulfonatronovibrionaceae bacterium]
MEILKMTFMQNALLAALLASIACGIIGSLVVINRLVFLSGGIAHTAYGGVGLAFFLGLPVLPCTLGITMLASLIMAGITVRNMENADTVIGVLWASGMALGIILLDISPGYNVDLMSYLFGSILTVPRFDIWIMLALIVSVLALTLIFYHDFLLMSFDPDFARTRGVAVTPLYFLLLTMIAVSVVMLIQVVGLILVIALLSIPPYLARGKSRSLAWMMLKACIYSLVFCLLGLYLSYRFNITSGACIIAVASAGFFTKVSANLLIPKKTVKNSEI